MATIYDDLLDLPLRPPTGPPWAVVLAGGRGSRLEAESTRLYGYPRPKQFCRFDGCRTPLDHTLDRVDRLVPGPRVVTLTTHAHRQEAREALRGRPHIRWVEQPTDRGTLPAVLLALLSILPEAWSDPVVMLPSDHHVDDDDAFMAHVAEAAAHTADEPDHVVVLGAHPGERDEGYGWIVPAPGPTSSPRAVLRFVEKPDEPARRALRSQGALVNTFALVARGQTLARLLRDADRLWWQRLTRAVPSDAGVGLAYVGTHPSDLSRAALEAFPERLRLLELRGLGWSDIGTPERLAAALPHSGLQDGGDEERQPVTRRERTGPT